jgi:hypothetical protein
VLPVAHAKQAVKAVEAVALLNTRWHQQQRHQEQQAHQGSGAALVLVPSRARVSSTAAGKRGVCLYVFAAPLPVH